MKTGPGSCLSANSGQKPSDGIPRRTNRGVEFRAANAMAGSFAPSGTLFRCHVVSVAIRGSAGEGDSGGVKPRPGQDRAVFQPQPEALDIDHRVPGEENHGSFGEKNPITRADTGSTVRARYSWSPVRFIGEVI